MNDYWGEEEENLVIIYISEAFSKFEKKMAAKKLIPKFKMIIDGLTSKFKLKKIQDSDKEDVLSWVFTILHKFQPDKEKKAFSYFTRCIQNKLKEINRRFYTIQWHGVKISSNQKASQYIKEIWSNQQTENLSKIYEEYKFLEKLGDDFAKSFRDQKDRKLVELIVSLLEEEKDMGIKQILAYLQKKTGMCYKTFYYRRQAYRKFYLSYLKSLNLNSYSADY